MDQFELWRQNLPAATREWLDHQPVWRDRDIAVCMAIALFMGFFLGYIAR